MLKIHPVQKMTSAGQTNRFVCYVLVGDTNGHIGLGSKCAKDTGRGAEDGIFPYLFEALGPKPYFLRSKKHGALFGSKPARIPFRRLRGWGTGRVGGLPLILRKLHFPWPSFGVGRQNSAPLPPLPLTHQVKSLASGRWYTKVKVDERIPCHGFVMPVAYPHEGTILPSIFQSKQQSLAETAKNRNPWSVVNIPPPFSPDTVCSKTTKNKTRLETKKPDQSKPAFRARGESVQNEKQCCLGWPTVVITERFK